MIDENLELLPIRWNRLIGKEMRPNNGIERAFRSHLIGIHSSAPAHSKDSVDGALSFYKMT